MFNFPLSNLPFQIDTDYTSFATFYSCFDAVIKQYEALWVTTRDKFPAENVVSIVPC